MTQNERQACHRALLAALTKEMAWRQTNPNWEQDERVAIAIAASEWAIEHGIQKIITAREVKTIEHHAVGHYDYASTLALHVTFLLYPTTPDTSWYTKPAPEVTP